MENLKQSPLNVKSNLPSLSLRPEVTEQLQRNPHIRRIYTQLWLRKEIDEVEKRLDDCWSDGAW